MQVDEPNGILSHLFPINLFGGPDRQLSVESMFAFFFFLRPVRLVISTFSLPFAECHDSRSYLTMSNNHERKCCSLVNPCLWWTVLKEL